MENQLQGSNSTASRATADEKINSLKGAAMIGYILALASGLIPFLVIGALIPAYIKRGEADGTWVYSHFRWQIRTIWFGLLWGILGGVTIFIGVGIFVLIGVGIWTMYRLIKGILRLNDRRDVYA